MQEQIFHTRTRPLQALVASLLLVISGCPGDIDAEPGCGREGIITACTCNGADGQRVCGDDGQWTSCNCDAPDADATADAADSDLTLDTAAHDLSDVVDMSATDLGEDAAADLAAEDSTEDSRVDEADMLGEVGSEDVGEDTTLDASPDAALDSATDAVEDLLDAVTDADDATDVSSEPDATPAPTPYIYFTDQFGSIHRVEARVGAEAEDLGVRLQELVPSEEEFPDRHLAVSRNGEWMVFESQRAFEVGCVGWYCLVIGRTNYTDFEAVANIAGAVVHPGETSLVVFDDGNSIIFGDSEGDRLDLYLIERSGEVWGTPAKLTGASTFMRNTEPALNAAETEILFTCDAVAYSPPGSSLCRVGVDGEGFAVIYKPNDYMPGEGDPEYDDNDLNHADYLADGRILFHANWFGQQLWTLDDAGEGPPVRFAPEVFWSDATPCALSNGDIASAWSGRRDATALNEVTLVDGGSGLHTVLVEGLQADEGGGLSCGGPPLAGE